MGEFLSFQQYNLWGKSRGGVEG